MSVRQAAKQATRARVLRAAHELFDEIGFEDATIRMIAKRANVSVGGVFTTFAGKTEILIAVMNERLGGLYDEFDRLLPLLRGPTVDRLRSIMAVHYNFEMRHRRLYVAYIVAAYTQSPQDGLMPIGHNAHFRSMLTKTLLAGVERGEVRKDVDVETFIDILVAAYVWNYRLTSSDGIDVVQLTEIMDRQIGLIFEGVAAR